MSLSPAAVTVYLLITLSVLLSCTVRVSECKTRSKRQSSDPISQPRITTENGHLIFQTGANHNISFRSGSGRVNIDNVDFGSLAGQVASTKLSLAAYRSQTDSSIQNTRTELTTFKGTATAQLTTHDSSIQSITSQMRAMNSTIVPFSRIRRTIRNQVRSINNQLQTISSNLLENNCQPDPCNNGGTCFDMYTAYRCFCPHNWRGTNCESDVNECLEYQGTVQACEHGTCVNSPGTFSCNCDEGWYGVLCNVHQSRCSAGSAQELCGHGTCINQGSNSYACLCDNGWSLDTSGSPPRCTQDINECEGGRSCSAGVQCINIPGTYVCGTCPVGYTGNGHVCSDINECESLNGGCSRNPLVECTNIVGGRLCGGCPDGYQGNGEVCVWVGICGINNGGCSPTAHCVENPALPNRVCRCASGYTGNGEGPGGCTPLPTPGGCNTNPCENGGRCVANDQGAYTCDCADGWTGLHCEDDIPECDSSPCQNGGTCTEQDGGGGGYTCTCQAWYTGTNCEEHRETCGGILNTQVGNIAFPASTDYPYPPNVSCAWRINVPLNMIIQVQFNQFQLETHPDCIYDFLQLNDGPTAASHLIGKYCGSTLPLNGNFNTTHNQLYLWFRSDHSIQGNGFNLHWVAALPSCGGVIEGETHGTIQSPGYPGTYPTSRDCVWTIEVPAGQTIIFTFGTLDLEHHDNCDYDYLEIRDGLLDTDVSLSKFCSEISPAPLSTGSNEAFVHFHSDPSETGQGFSINWHAEQASCGATYELDEGVVISPNYPNHYDHNADCYYLIRMPAGAGNPTLTFTNFGLESATNCRYDYLEIYDGGNDLAPLLGRFCGTYIPGPFVASTSQIYLKFHTDVSVHSDGFRATWGLGCGGLFNAPTGAVYSPLYPSAYPHNKDCYYHVSVAPDNAIILTFQSFNVEDANGCVYDYLAVYDGSSADTTQIGTYCGTSGPGVLTTTGPDMYLHFHTDGSVTNLGFYANYTSQPQTVQPGECGGILTGSEGTITSPGHPGSYPHGVQCEWQVIADPGFRIRLNFHFFEIESHTNCIYDYVEVFDNSTSTDTGGSLGRYCGTTSPPVLTSVENRLLIRFVTDGSVALEGFSATYSTFNYTVCGDQRTSLPGLITSPNYPGNYPHQRECVWTIAAPNNHQILLNFTSFSMESHPQCQYDYIEIRNGGYSTSPLVGRYCGNRIDGPFVSHGSQMWLKFKSDVSFSAPGFSLWYEDAGEGCGADLTSPSGSFVSPNYPAAYNHNGECYWTITVARGSSITVVFVVMDIESHSSCNYDYVEVLDGVGGTASSLGKFCGAELPHPVVSSGNQVTVKFRADFSISGSGFHGLYFASCQNQELTGRYGVIESPNFPGPYPASRECSWVIQGHQGDTINASFSHMEVEHNAVCQYDFVQIRDGNSASAPLIGTYCGESLPPAISSTTNSLFIRFNSDASLAYNGFRLEWITNGCGEDLTGPSGVLLSPNYPNTYPVRRTCVWLITVATGSSVTFTVNDIDVEHQANCNFDKLEVFNGRDETAPRIGQFCGSATEGHQVTSTGNVMYVTFHSDVSLVGRGFNASYSTVEGGCGGSFTAPEGQITSKNYPAAYPHNTFCEYNITVEEGRTVELSFTEFHIEFHDTCIYDYVAVYDGPNSNSTELMKSCGDQTPNGTIVSSSNQMYVKMVTDALLNGRGFRANYKTGCGGRITVDADGSITSPNYPSNYDSSHNCSWVLTGSQAVDRITVQFTHMDLEESSNCTHDYIEVRMGDNSNAPVHGTYCGTSIPSSITSTGNAIFLRFVTDGVVVRSGFRAAYSKSVSFCGGNLTAEQGAFNTPRYPDSYPNGAECVWILNSSPGNQLQLSFSVFNLQYQADCNYDYVEIREGGNLGNVLGRYCGSQAPTSVTVGHSLWVKFRSDPTVTGQGFMAQFSALHGGDITGQTEGQIASPLYPNNYPHNDDYQWTVTVANELKIKVTFIDLDMEDNNCVFDFLRFRDGGLDISPEILTACGSEAPAPFTTTANQLRVEFHTDQSVAGRGFLIKWEATSETILPTEQPGTATPPCYFDLSVGDSPQNISQPGFPGYANFMNCLWRLTSPPGTKVTVSVLFLDIEYHPSCFYDGLDVIDGVSGLTVQRLCGRSLPPAPISSSSNIMHLRFQSDYVVTKDGFLVSAYQSCGGSFQLETTGVMMSPEFPTNYPSNSDCTWVIRVKNGRTIEYNFENFNIQSSLNCQSDYLQLLNGGNANSPALANPVTEGRFCGTSTPVNGTRNFVTSSNLGYVRFVSDSSPPIVAGFKLTFTEKNVVCGGHLTLTDDVTSGTFTSPNYPQPYPHNVDCTWVITVPATERVQLHFTDFDVENHGSCAYDEVVVRDGGTSNSQQLLKYCGRTPPSTVKSTGNVMYVRFRADDSVSTKGFFAQYQIASCGGTYTGLLGEITSPNYPQNYENGQECEWYIGGPTGHFLSLTFDVFQIQLTNLCTADWVEVHERNHTGHITDAIGRYCGPNAPSPITTSDSFAYIKFKSDATSVATGFHLTYNASIEVCGGELTGSSGVFTSPNYPGLYPHSRSCFWEITVPEGRRVTLTFTDFNIETHTNCYWDYVQVYNGLLDESPFIGRYCGTTAPLAVQSSGNTMMVMFRTDGSVSNGGFSATYSSNEDIVCGGVIDGLPNSNGVITSPNFGTANYTNNQQCIWKLRGPDGGHGSIRVDFTDFQIERHGECVYDFVELREGSTSPEGRLIGRFCGNTPDKAPPLLVSPYPAVWLAFITDFSLVDAGFRLVYNFSDCGGLLTDPAGVITSPGFPSAYTHRDACAWEIVAPEGFQIRLTVESFNVELHDKCQYDWLEIFNGGSADSPSFGSYCGSSGSSTAPPSPLVSQSNKLRLEFHTDQSASAPGFRISYSTVSAGCGGTYHGQTGYITSPGFPGSYPPLIECEWTIIVDAGYHVELTFNQPFELEVNTGCNADYVQLTDVHSNGTEITSEKHCGTGAPPPTNSTHTTLKVKFRSNSNSQNNGFSANWTAGCGATYEGDTGVIVSPGYPSNYGSNLYCEYTVAAHPSKFVVLSFDENFHVDGFSPCRGDSVSAFEGTNLLGRFCGNVAPQAVASRSSLGLVFRSDSFGTDSGFKATYTVSNCGGNFTSPDGIIRTPTHPVDYHNDLNCTWRITLEQNKIVKLKFTVFDVESHSSCNYDYVEVRDGPTLQSPLLGRLCGTTVPEEILSTGNSMTLNFITDSSVTKGGFVAGYETGIGAALGCGGERRIITVGATATIPMVDVDGDGRYDHNLDCVWTVWAPDEESVVEITFTNMDVESHGTCQYDGLEVYDGVGTGSSLAFTLCGSTGRSFTGASDVVTVRFYSDSSVSGTGYTLTYKAVPRQCGGLLTAGSSPIPLSFPPAGTALASGLNCRWVLTSPSSQGVRVKVTSLDLTQSVRCVASYLQVADQPLEQNGLVGQDLHFCGTALPGTVDSIGQNMMINMKTGVNPGTGFTLSYQTATCDHIYTGDNGRVVSPGYPGNYPQNVNCMIRLAVPAGRKVSLYFNSFYVEYHSNCNFDYLKIFDGNSTSSALLSTNCGQLLPQPVFSSSGLLLLWFKTDASVTHSGFDVTYTSSPLSGCGGNLTGTVGSFTSPAHPGQYPTNSDCSWIIRVGARYLISLEFTQMDITSGADNSCDLQNSVSVRDGDSGDANLLGQYCGGNSATVLSNSNALYVTFKSGSTSGGSGFRATYSTSSSQRALSNATPATGTLPAFFIG